MAADTQRVADQLRRELAGDPGAEFLRNGTVTVHLGDDEVTVHVRDLIDGGAR